MIKDFLEQLLQQVLSDANIIIFSVFLILVSLVIADGIWQLVKSRR